MYRILTIFLLMPFWVLGQTHTSVDQGSTLYRFKNGVKIDSALFLPRKDTGITDLTMLAPGMLVYRPMDSLLYWRKGDRMTPVASGTGSLGDYYTKAESDGMFVHYIDTALMLLPYLRKIDTTAMLAPYLRKIDTAAMLSGYVRSTRTINTTSPLQGGANLSSDLTLSIQNASANGTTKGAATFRPQDFDDNGNGQINLDTINGPSYTKTQSDAKYLTFNTLLTPLLAGDPVPVQPTNTVLEAIENLNARLNAQTGKYIDNQNTTYLTQGFKMSGLADIQATSAAGAVNIRRGAALNYYPIVNFQTMVGSNMGYVGAGSNTDENRVDLTAILGGVKIVSRDTSSVRFGNYDPVNGGRVATGYKGLKWLMLNQFPINSDRYFDTTTLYSKTLNVYGGILSDTVYANGYYYYGGSAGQLLRMDASGTRVESFTASFAPASGSANYIQNQSALAQSSSSFWVSGSSRTNGVHSMGSTSRITGTGTGASNVALFSFRESDNSTETGFIGDVSSGNSNIALSSVNGDIALLSGGSTKATISNTSTSVDIAGSVGSAITTVSTNTTLDQTHHTLRATASGITLTFPAASSCPRRIYVIINYNTGGVINTSNYLTPAAATGNSVANQTTLWVQSDGSNWYQIK